MNVEVFTTPTCEDCRSFKKFLSEHRIPFTEFNIADLLSMQIHYLIEQEKGWFLRKRM